MRPRPRSTDKNAIRKKPGSQPLEGKLGLVLSGGGSRAAYQAGALKALIPYLERNDQHISIIVGSSIGSINGLILGACIDNGLKEAVGEIESLWRMRTFRNTFSGSPSMAFFRAIRIAAWQYLSPGPKPTSDSIFDPTPLMTQVDEVLKRHGGLAPEDRDPKLEAMAVITTMEGEERKPLLFLSSHKTLDDELLSGASFQVCNVPKLTAKHGFASAALPSVLPPVELDTEHGQVRLVDGGISQNVPVDPAVRLGAERVIVIDISGRLFWFDQYQEAHDTRPDWEVPAGLETFCMRPPDTFIVRNKQPFGPILKQAVSKSTRKFIEAVGPTWPIFKILQNKLGEDLAYEVMSYVALDPDYIHGLIERGYNETTQLLKSRAQIEFHQNRNFEELVALEG